MSDKVNHELEYRYPIDQTARIAALDQRSEDMSKTITLDNIKYTPSIIQRMEREAARMYAQDQKHQMQIAQLEGAKRTLAARSATLEQKVAQLEAERAAAQRYAEQMDALNEQRLIERAALVEALEHVLPYLDTGGTVKGIDVLDRAAAALAAVRVDPAQATTKE